MKKYTVEITEILRRNVEVEGAESSGEALAVVMDKYHDGEIKLGANDYVETLYNSADERNVKK